MTENNELCRIWKELLLIRLYKETMENHENLCQDSQSLCHKLILGPLKYDELQSLNFTVQ
jgi:hypothetical protein